MLDKFEGGFNNALVEMLEGLIPPILISCLASAGLFPFYLVLGFHILSIIGMISLIEEISLRKTSYIVGWLFGVFLLAYTGILPLIDFLIYLIPIGYLVYKKKYRK